MVGYDGNMEETSAFHFSEKPEGGNCIKNIKHLEVKNYGKIKLKDLKKLNRNFHKYKLTPGEKRKVNNLEKLIKEIKRINQIRYHCVKDFNLNNLHNAIKVRYSKDECSICKSVIRGSHFHDQCSAIKIFVDNGINIYFARYYSWIGHCLLKHKNRSLYRFLKNFMQNRTNWKPGKVNHILGMARIRL